MWQTGAIFTRIDSQRIITYSKTCYELSGPIDSTKQDSNVICSNFIEGFPESWKEMALNR